MDADKMINLPSDAIAKDAATDEFGKDMKGNNIGGFPSPFADSASTPKILDPVLDVIDNGGRRQIFKGENLKVKIEKDGSVSMDIKLPDGGAPEIVPAYDPEIETQKVILFLKAPMSTEFSGGDNNKVMVVKVCNLPPQIDKKDMVTVLENRQLVIELKTVLEDYGKIKKVAELPAGVTVSGISTLMEDRILTVTVALEKPEPEKKPKSIISKTKGALAKAWPACFAIGAKMGFDAITNNDAN